MVLLLPVLQGCASPTCDVDRNSQGWERGGAIIPHIAEGASPFCDVDPNSQGRRGRGYYPPPPEWREVAHPRAMWILIARRGDGALLLPISQGGASPPCDVYHNIGGGKWGCYYFPRRRRVPPQLLGRARVPLKRRGLRRHGGGRWGWRVGAC